MSQNIPFAGLKLEAGYLITESLRRLSPRHLAHNPVMLIVALGTVVTALLAVTHAVQGQPYALDAVIAAILLFTVLFANAAE